MALLGVDVDDLNGVSIGNWNSDDELLWPLAKVMQNNGAFWRIKYSTELKFTGTTVRYVGIEHPVYGDVVNDDTQPARKLGVVPT